MNHELDPKSGILTLRPTGPLTAADFATITREADAHIQEHGKLHGILISTEKFPGWTDVQGLKAHFRFVRDHHADIERVALVSDSKLLGFLPHLASHFIKAEIKTFGFEDEAQARTWLSS